MAKTKRIVYTVVLAILLLGCSIALSRRFISRTIVVPDQYVKICDAIAKARSGDTVLVRAGVYKEWVRFKNGIKLIGEGEGLTIISNDDTSEHVIFVEDCNEGIISSLSIQHGGQLGALYLANSSIEVSDCTINQSSASGIFITRGGSPVIHDCVLESNPYHGIVVDGILTRPVIRNNLCSQNKVNGIYFHHGARGKVEGNTCIQNMAGIVTSDLKTNVSLTNNRCISNKYWGISIGGGAATIKENICEKNKKAGIYVRGRQTIATLQKNICQSNKEHGIFFGAYARGTVEGNTCEENESSGIRIALVNNPVLVRDNTCRANYKDGICFTSRAKATAQNNVCIDNDWRGIMFENGASGRAEGNVCEGNAFPGILVYESGTIVTLRNNICRRNYPSGIVFSNGAAGKAEINICEDNPWSGIAVRGKGSDPNIAGNRCNDNGVWGIIYWAGAQPAIADNNVTLNNGKEGIKRRD
jgi:parallel beta-helix repeat protein